MLDYIIPYSFYLLRLELEMEVFEYEAMLLHGEYILDEEGESVG